MKVCYGSICMSSFVQQIEIDAACIKYLDFRVLYASLQKLKTDKIIQDFQQK
jgi:hypothetical protein